MSQITLLAAFAIFGGILLLGYIFSRWMTWRVAKNKPAFTGIGGAMETGVQKYTAEGKDGPRIITAVIAYLVFLAFLAYVAFNNLPSFLQWLG